MTATIPCHFGNVISYEVRTHFCGSGYESAIAASAAQNIPALSPQHAAPNNTNQVKP